jgi:pSer/pThr/pTyr-binding forkhead associated (FHA) protein/tetratricopeptide (TPR) repeat protein
MTAKKNDLEAKTLGHERQRAEVGLDEKTLIRSENGDEPTPARPRYKPPYMVLVDGPRAGAHFPLGDGQNIIGRAPAAAIRLEDQSVSRQHAEITKGVSGWMVKDLGSKNGTSVNGKPIVDSVVIGHKDIVKTGVYQLRLVTQPISPEEEMMLPVEAPPADRTVFVSAAPDASTSRMEDDVSNEIAEGPQRLPDLKVSHTDEEGLKPKRFGKRQVMLFGLLAVALIFTTAYFASRMLFKSKVPVQKPVAAKPLPSPTAPLPVSPDVNATAGPATGQPAPQPMPPASPPGTPPAVSTGTAGVPPVPPSGVPTQAQGVPAVPTPLPVKPIPVFLDFQSSPMPADVTFRNEKIGRTPVRVNAELEPDKEFEATAQFDMLEIKEQFTQGVKFKVEKDSTVIPILFKGPIGMIKVDDLPRDVEFYLEGNYSYDKFQARSAKLTEVVLQKPIYIPYGDYKLELRRSRQLGQASQTYVSDIIFKREFKIAEESPTFVIGVKEEDLSVFPAKIRSEPENADVFIDSKSVGKTPYEGMLPLGEHKMTLRKEGYFEYSENLKVDINTPYDANVQLKTSVAGAHLNNAKLAMSRQMFQEAINELAEALSSQPAPSEVANANYLLGVCYLNMNDIQRAMGYFEQARENETFRYPAMLGLVNGYAMMDKADSALPLLVEVLLKAKDEATKKEANSLFQKISPFRSVMYIYSDPPGASVVVNDKTIAQKTPVILHDLPLGSYKLRIEKLGYVSTDLNLSLSVNEFNPIIVKLKPIPR